MPKGKPTLPETEKITINLGSVDLGQIDLLVQEGFYSNRTDLIRTGIRNQLAAHADVVKQAVARKSLSLGIQRYARAELEAVRAAGQRLRIQALGLVVIGEDVTPELAVATIESIAVLGALHASPAVKTALGKRIR
jgi:Arc/MetJ-type ribon-helix-helix transcriptional regulator